jgi:hypothetical protein
VKPYRRYPGPDSRDRVWWLVIIVALLLALTLVVRLTTGDAAHRPVTVQARRDANARAVTVRRLRSSLAHSPSLTEAIRLAHVVYPMFSETRAWQIIRHESGGDLYAYNRTSVNGCHATGVMQFLDCTFRSTPYRSFSIYSPYAQLLAAGWMHSVGRGCEWSIGEEC